MRIGIDLRSTQTDISRNRGIGIFTRAVVENILHGWGTADSGERDEFFLIYDPSQATSTLKPVLSTMQLTDCCVTWIPVPPALQSIAKASGTAAINGAFNAFLASLRLNLLHLSSALESDISLPTHIVVCPYIVTLYDLVPLIYDKFFLPHSDPSQTQEYIERLGLVMRADHVMAISECSRADAQSLLGLKPGAVSVAYPAADSAFGPRNPADALVDLSRYGITKPYIFSVTGYFTPNKSPESLVAAFAALPPDVREAYQLVLTVKLLPNMRERFMTLAEKYDIAAQIVLTDETPFEVLLALYRQCSVYAHLSHYEGFGLPVLEALHCGAPCVVANRASLPEIVSDAGVLVDPENAVECARAFADLLSAPQLRAELAERGKARAAQFTWEDTAQQYREVYRQVGMQSAGLADDVARELRIALWTPLRPTNTGIADYVEELLPYFAAWRTDRPVRVDIFTQSEPENWRVRDNYAFFAPAAFEALNAWRPYDASIYHIGATYAHHEFIYKQALKHPGIIVMHDPILHAYPFAQTLAARQSKAYLDCVAEEEGESLREFAWQALAKVKFWDALYYEYNMDKNLLRNNQAAIYHSYFAMRDSQERLPGVATFYIPLFSEYPSDAPSAFEAKEQIRNRYNLPDETIIIGTFGFMSRPKRIDVLIRAFNMLTQSHKQLVLLIVGNTSFYDPLHEAQQAGYSTERVYVTGEVAMGDFITYLQAVDIGVSLRYPTLGETSAVMSRLMGMGKPLVVSDIPQFRELPDECCWKVPVNNHEVKTLASYLRELTDDPELRTQMGQNAQQYARACMDPSYVADLYRQVIEHVVNGAPAPHAEMRIPRRYRHQADLAVLMKRLRHHLRRDTMVGEGHKSSWLKKGMLWGKRRI